MTRLSNHERSRAIGMLETGKSQKWVAQRLQCTQSTISKLVRRLADTGRVEDRPRSGRPRETTAADDRWIRLQHLRHRTRFATTTALDTLGRRNIPVCANTVRRRLMAAGLSSRRPFKGPVLTAIHRANRLRWCQEHLGWTQQMWSRVLFTDESRFCIDMADGRDRVWRRRGERYAECCIRQFNRWGGANVMVWAGMSSHYRTELVIVEGNLTARRYIDEVLTPHVLPFLRAHPDIALLQQDNARPHAAAVTADYLHENNVAVMPWMPYSPDLSPIEHLWDELGRRIQRRQPRPANREMLIRALHDEWERIPQETVRNLANSMRRRCLSCINARGGHTRY